MQLILAIDSDPRRSEQLASLVRSRLAVDLVQATSAGEALHALKDRVPDLILTSPLLSPFDDGVLDEYLRDLGAAATHVQTLRIPMLSSGPNKKSAAKRLFSLGRKKPATSPASPDGCDPKVFADEIAHYLTRSLEERSASAKATTDKSAAANATADESAVADVRAERPDAAPSRDDGWNDAEVLAEASHEPAQTAAVVSAGDGPDTYFPGSILDLRPPAGHTPEPDSDQAEPDGYLRPEYVEPPAPAYVEQVHVEPTYVEMALPVSVDQESEFVTPEPMRIDPDPVLLEPGVNVVEPEPIVVAPAAPVGVALPTVSEAPAPAIVMPESVAATRAGDVPSATPGTSASFEAALAAIRAAWAKPEQKKTSSTDPAPAAGSRPLSGSGEIDLTKALDNVTIVDGNSPDDDSPDESGAPPQSGRRTEKPRKRPDKPRARKARGDGGPDDWAVLDPNTEFSTLVKQLDEVTDSEDHLRQGYGGRETTTRATNVR
jgi:hypothetical protein